MGSAVTREGKTMRSKLRLGIGTGLAVTAVAAVLAGCSGSTTGKSTTGGTGIGGSLNGSAISLVADAMNKANSAGTVRVTGTISAAGTTLTLDAHEQYSPTLEMSMDMQGTGMTMSEIFIGDKLYMKYPQLSAQFGGKPWLEIDLSGAGGTLGSLSSLINSARNENPTTTLSALVASKEVSKVGTETVQGQQTTHYSGTLNADQFLQNSAVTSQLSSAQADQLKSMLKAGGVTSEKIDVWVASNGLPVQLKSAVHSTSAGEADITMDMSDWGTPVQVSAPAADQVTDITSQMGSLMGTASAN